MKVLPHIFHTHTEVTEENISDLRDPLYDGQTVQIRPPRTDDLPATLPGFIDDLLEIQTDWTSIRNHSPRIAFEIRRPRPDDINLQLSVPTARLARKLRSSLTTEIPGLEFTKGEDGLPISEGDTIGGGTLTNGRRDRFPFKTDPDQPLTNSIVANLHPHAMQRTKIVIQILAQPIAGHPIHRWWWKRTAYKKVGKLRKEKHLVWHDRPPTPREKKQSKLVEQKAANIRYKVSIRFVIINAGEHTQSRVKEVGGPFNRLESDTTGQYFDIATVWSPLKHRLIDYGEAVANRRFNNWHRSFRLTEKELAALVTLPDRSQDNLTPAQP
jgi:hypothetical protein